MATTENKDIVYPTSGDQIAPLETHFASLAESTDAALVLMDTDIENVQTDLDDFKEEVGVVPEEGSFSFTGPATIATPVNLTVTLPSGKFTTEPVVVATVSGANSSSAFFPVIHSTTTSQFRAKVWRMVVNPTIGAATISIASPAVVTRTGHGLADGDKVYFTTTGALPTGLLAGSPTTNNYFVRDSNANTFRLSLSSSGSLINTSGTQSGTHTLVLAAQENLKLNWIAK
jgi:hypothetical protein